MGGISDGHHRTRLWIEGGEFILIEARADPLCAHAKTPHECGDSGVFLRKSLPESSGRGFSIMDELNAAVPAVVSLPASKMAVLFGAIASALGTFFLTVAYDLKIS